MALNGVTRSLPEVTDRARRRWIRLMVAISVLGGLGGFLGPILFGEPSRHPHHRHVGGTNRALIAATIALLVLFGIAAVAFAVFRKAAARDGFFSAPLVTGLPRSERRRVLRAVRAGRPSADPTLRIVEQSTAARLVGQARLSVVILFVALVGEIAVALTANTLAGRIFFSAAAAFFVVIIGVSFRNVRGARHYLKANENERAGRP